MPHVLRASFTNSLRQRKPSFGIKIVLSGFTNAQWRISAEKAWTVIFAPDLIEYAFLGVSLSDAKVMEESIQVWEERYSMITIFNAPEKACLKLFCAWNAAIIVARRRDGREQRACGRRQRIFFHTLFILNARRTHYPNLSFAKRCYF